MVRRVRRWSIAAALMVMVGLMLVPAAVSAGSGNGDKVFVCHTTESAQNPWVIVWVDWNGWVNGHQNQHLRSNGNFDVLIGSELPEGVTKHDADGFCGAALDEVVNPPTTEPPTEGDVIPLCDPDAVFMPDLIYMEISDGVGGTCLFPVVVG